MEGSFFHRIVNKLPIGIIRLIFNLWPPFRGAGIKVDAISPDYRSFAVSLRSKLLNKNYVGVHFGGSLFAMVDAFYMIILSKNLGSQYIVWDKAATIEFKKPARGTIQALCLMTEEEISDVKNQADQLGKYVFDRKVDLFNAQNEVVATVVKTLYVRKQG